MLLLLLARLAASKRRYGIMIDAGSSGTRAHLYSWESTKGIPNVQPYPDKNAFKKIPIPLAKAAKNISVISDIFTQIISFAARNLPPGDLSKTRIYVYATAGMRLLPDVDQARVIEKTFEFLSDHSPFKVKKTNIRVIDGLEEGVFGWLSVNHLLGNFQSGQPTVGALDMGGASFQIALEVGKSEKPRHTVTIGSKVIPLYAHSYLGYGANEALKTITRAMMAVLPPSDKPLKHPCYPSQLEGEYKGRKFVGTGDFEQCSALTDEILLQSSVFASIEVPSLKTTNEFVGMASFYYLNKALNLKEDSSLEDLKRAVSEFCAADWSKTAEKSGDNEFTRTYCWYGIYQWNLMHRGFDFQDGKTKVSKLDTIDGVDLSWTIGAMLGLVAEIEIDEQPKFAYHSLIAANIVAFCVLFPVYVWMERRRRAPRRFSGK